MFLDIAFAPRAPFFDAGLKAHIITRYTDVAAIVASPKVTVPRIELDVAVRLNARFPDRFSALSKWAEGILIHLDGPKHVAGRDRAKGMVRHAWDSLSAAKLKARAERLLDDQGAAGKIDGTRLAADYIDGPWSDLLLLSLEDARHIIDGSEGCLTEWSQIVALNKYQERNAKTAALMDRVLAKIRLQPCPWSTEGFLDIDAPVMLFILGLANATVKHTITNMLYTLAADQPEQDRVRRDPSRISAFVEEVLRMYGAVRFRDRIAGPDGLEDYAILPGERIRLYFESAGRDPDVYPDPNRFAPERYLDTTRPAPILSFGGGSHLCVGRLLARLQMAALISALVERYTLIFDERNPVSFPDIASLGFKKLPLRLAPR